MTQEKQDSHLIHFLSSQTKNKTKASEYVMKLMHAMEECVVSWLLGILNVTTKVDLVF
jgi:hypothetical protein